MKTEYDFENAPCGYISFYPDGTIVQINQTLLNWINYTREEIINIKKTGDITSKGTSLYFQMFVYPLLKMQGYVNEVSLDILSSKNIAISCLFNASAVKNEDGNIKHINAILFIISERKKI